MDRTGMNHQDARWLVDHFFEGLTRGLILRERVEIRGTGVFKLVERNQAHFLNPKNGAIYGGGKVKTILFQPSMETM
jgi:nucleoid DNA-binding protein